MKNKILSVGILAMTFVLAGNAYAVGQNEGTQGSADPSGIHEPGTGLENPEMKAENQGTGQGLSNTSEVVNSVVQSITVGTGTVATGTPVQQRLRDGSETGNEVRNQGEEKQAQNQLATSAGKLNGLQNAEQRRSQVANAVQAMLQVADRNGGIGQQVKEIAQNQTQNQEKLEAGLEKVQSRSGIAKFFFGPNYGEINKAKQVLVQNQEQIIQLNQLKAQITNETDAQNLAEQIQVLEQTNSEIQNSLNQSEKGFSLLGWAFKMFAK
jgi:hypothetical protein